MSPPTLTSCESLIPENNDTVDEVEEQQPTFTQEGTSGKSGLHPAAYSVLLCPALLPYLKGSDQSI